MDARLAVRRKPEFRNEEATLLSSIGQDGEVAIYYLYDAFDATEEDLVALRESVVADSRVDELVELRPPPSWGTTLLSSRFLASTTSVPRPPSRPCACSARKRRRRSPRQRCMFSMLR